ncbi:hypothetical protein [Luteimonas sp. e5]
MSAITRLGLCLALLALGAPAASVQAAPGDKSLARQASQCLALYRIAATLPGNAAHRDDLERLAALMGRSMQDAGVDQAQFERHSADLLARIGTPQKPDKAVLAREVERCNGFAKQRWQHYTAARG